MAIPNITEMKVVGYTRKGESNLYLHLQLEDKEGNIYLATSSGSDIKVEKQVI
jgi:hypothetical protein